MIETIKDYNEHFVDYHKKLPLWICEYEENNDNNNNKQRNK